jgi:hypothetical protein
VRRWSRRLLAAVAVAAVLGACSGEGDDGSDALPAENTSSTSTTVAEDEHAAAALRVWEEYLDVSQEWLDPPDPAHPRIADFIAPDALEDFREGIAVELAKDTARRPSASGPPHHETTVRSSSASSVVIEDCFVDDFVAYNFRTGEVVDDAVATRTLEVAFVEHAGAWKIGQIRELDKVDGRAGCGE